MTERSTGPVAAQAFAVGVAALAVAGSAVRLIGLGDQDYWGDEQFSVEQTRTTLGYLWQVGLQEVHPPFWALMLHGWIEVGGTRPEWTRLSSALAGVLTVLVAWHGLSRTRLSAAARSLAVAVTATSGAGIVYAQETRSYVLLLLAATGLTAATVRLAQPASAEAVAAPRRTLRSWVLWGLVASATHLFGALLAAAAAAVLARDAPAGRRRPLAVAAAVAVAPQVLWLAAAVGRPGFPQSTGWIPAPDAEAVALLATTLLSAGGLSARNDGFAWTASWGVLTVALVALLAVGLRRRTTARPAGATDPPDVIDASDTGDAAASVLLLRVAGLLVVGVFLVSQVVHVWTLRNLLVVQPALGWGLAAGLLALPRRARDRWLVAAVLLVACAASLAATVAGLREPYKGRTGAVAEYVLVNLRARPDTRLVIGDVVPPSSWFLSTDRSPDDPAVTAALARAVRIPRTVADLERVTRSPDPMIVVYVPGVAARDRVSGKGVDTLARELVARLGDPACRQVPFAGVVVVDCGPLPRLATEAAGS